MRNFTKRTATVAVAAVALSGVGVAFAYWTTTGTGTGSATAGSGGTPITINHAGVSGLVPVPTVAEDQGGYSNISVTVTNPNTYSQDVGNITATKASVTRTADAIAANLPCATSEFDLVEVADDVAPLAAGATSVSTVAAKVRLVDNPAANQDGCKGATLNLTFAAAQGS